MSHTIFLLAEAAAPDAIAGGAGWAGAGLLGLVLAWLLLTHLPAKDKQMRDLINDFRAGLQYMADIFRSEQKEYRAAADEEHKRCWQAHDQATDKLQGLEREMVLLRQQQQRSDGGGNGANR